MKSSMTQVSTAVRRAISGVIERDPLELKPWSNNPRAHSQKQLSKLKASIRKFGFTTVVVVDEDSVILCGHGRVQASIELGLDVVPVRIVTGLSTKEKLSYLLADNKIALLSSWTDSSLNLAFDQLAFQDDLLVLTGFDTSEIDLVFAGHDEEKISEESEVSNKDIPIVIVSMKGDLWQLGPHRLLCGNALDAGAYQRLMGDKKARMCITDPPYNLPSTTISSSGRKTPQRNFLMASGEMTVAEFTKFLSVVMHHINACTEPGATIFFFMDWRHIEQILAAAVPVFGALAQLCVWAKNRAGMGSFYRSAHELVFVFRKQDGEHVNNFRLGENGRYRTNVWSYDSVRAAGKPDGDLIDWNSCSKNIAMIADAIMDVSHRGEIVLDPYVGVGTIYCAAQASGRVAYGIEISEFFVDLSVRRWMRLTGEQAVLEDTGQTWDEVTEQRARLLSSGDGHGI
jgi:hypothetical protein